MDQAAVNFGVPTSGPAWPGLGPAQGPPVSTRQVSFSELLGRTSGSGDTSLTREQRATAAAEQLVAVALVQPLLAQLRATNSAAPPFAPTGAEKQMRSLQDAEVARQITHAARFPLVDRLARRMLNDPGRAGAGAPGE